MIQESPESRLFFGLSTDTKPLWAEPGSIFYAYDVQKTYIFTNSWTQAFGTVTGTVTGSETGNPALSGIEVRLYSSADALMGTTATDASGNYSVGNLPTGDYKVWFGPNANHLAEYYDDKASLGEATLVPVTIPSTTTVNAVLTKDVGTIAGTVYDEAGGTLSGCYVRVYYASTGASYNVVMTDASGNYSMANVPSGNYKVWFTKTGYVSEWYDNQYSLANATPITVTAASTTTISPYLDINYGTISGTVKGSESGYPALANIEVKIYSSTDVLMGTIYTNSSGVYSMGGLLAGTYKVWFGPNANHLPEWNYNKSSQETADLVTVNWGTTTTVNAYIIEAYGSISGTVTGNETGTPVLPGVVVKAYNGSDVQVGTTATTDSGGVYTITGLPSGTYRVNFGGDPTHLAADNEDVVVAIGQTTTSDIVLEYSP